MLDVTLRRMHIVDVARCHACSTLRGQRRVSHTPVSPAKSAEPIEMPL